MVRGRILVRVFVGSALFGVPALGTQSSVAFIRADDVHAQGFTGQDVTVAIVDTGIIDHPGLAGKVAAGGISFEGGVLIADGGTDPYPQHGYHGTYMSLIVADATGVAPGSLILPVRVFGPSGFSLTDLELGVQYVIDRRMTVDPSIRVINLSLGSFDHFSCVCNSSFPVLANAISQALFAGIVTFAATGNDAFCGGITSPACVSDAVRVAASFDGGYPTQCFDPPANCCNFLPPAYRITCFSNIVEDCNFLIAAPGFSITVGGFSNWGTSQATAHCSGVAALLFGKAGCSPPSAFGARSIIFNSASTHKFAFGVWCNLPPQPKHVDALAACNQVVATPPCTIVAADPPHANNNPYQPGQPFRDVLQNTDTALTPRGIGAAGTPNEGTIGNYAAPQVTFSGIPLPTPDPSNITVSCTGGACPTVTAVSGTWPTFTISLSGVIPLLQCTTITFGGTGAIGKLQYQVLPGDTNLSGMTNTQDMLQIVQALNNGTAGLPANLARYDIDRGGTVNTQDILRLIQLLNGTNTTQPFNGATVAACPP